MAYSRRLWSLGGEVEQRFDGFLEISGLGTTRVTLGVAADGSDTSESGDKPALERLWDCVQLVGFHQRLQDGIVRTSIETPEGNRFQRVNQDAVHGTGLELLANTRFYGVVLSGDLTVQDVTGRDADGSAVELEYEPAFTVKLGVQKSDVFDVVASADMSVAGSQLCQNPEIGGLEAFDTSPRLDLGLRRVFGLPGFGGFGRGEGSFSVSNVGDARD